jgi:hypothetical protein
VASRKGVRPHMKITSRCSAATATPAITPAWMRRTRPKGSTLNLMVA